MARLTTDSYEKYLTKGLVALSEHLSLKVYKTCPVETNPVFSRGEDLRIQLRWKKDPIHEFFVDKTFWYVSNKDKDDKKYMRSIADQKLTMISNAIIRPKKKVKVWAEGSYRQKDHIEDLSLTGNKPRKNKRKKKT